MKKRHWKRLAFALVLVYVLVMLASVFLWINQEPFLAEVPIGDGARRIRLLHAGHGPMNYSWSDPRPRFIRLLTPRLLRKTCQPVEVNLDGQALFRFGGFGANFESPAETLLLRTVDSGGEYVDDLKLHRKRIELVDSRGFSFLPGMMEKTLGRGGSLIVERTSVPRRDENLTISIVDQETGADPIELTVKNPFFRKDIPVWKGSGLPQSVFFDDTLITLESLEVKGLGIHGRIRTEGRNWRYEAFSLWFEDATGNRGLWLSPDEPAWKAHLTIFPCAFEALPQDAIVQLPPIEQPTDGNPVPLNETLKIGGTEVRLVELSTRFDQSDQSKPSASPKNQLVLKVRVPGAPYRVPIFCRTVEPDGTRSRQTGHRGTGDKGEWLMQFPMTKPADNAPVTIELGLEPKRELTFMVTPPEELKAKMREFVISSRVRKPKEAAGAMPGMAGAPPMGPAGLPSTGPPGGTPE